MTRFTGEPELTDILSDPIVQALMRADGLDAQSLYASLAARADDGDAADRAAAPEGERE